jgi:hypothetical protein
MKVRRAFAAVFGFVLLVVPQGCSQKPHRDVEVLNSLEVPGWSPVREATRSRDQGGPYGERFYLPDGDLETMIQDLCDKAKSGVLGGYRANNSSSCSAKPDEVAGVKVYPVRIGLDVEEFNVYLTIGFDLLSRGSENRGALMRSLTAGPPEPPPDFPLAGRRA